jgi:hypothetical protein
MRVESPKPAKGNGGGWIHRLGTPLAALLVKRDPKEKPYINWTVLAQTMFESPTAADERNYLAKTLGVKESALVELGVGRGWDEYRGLPYSSWPERDPKGNVVGIVRRYRDGAKKTMRHSSHGLYYAAPILRMSRGPVFLPEGGSDTCCLIGIGVNAVGRPSNLAGVDMLTELLAGLLRKRCPQAVIVLGERDQKPNGDWPGKLGAVETAKRLGERLKTNVGWRLPPAKDVRAWLQTVPTMTGPQFLQAVRTW